MELVKNILWIEIFVVAIISNKKCRSSSSINLMVAFIYSVQDNDWFIIVYYLLGDRCTTPERTVLNNLVQGPETQVQLVQEFLKRRY